MLAVGEHKLGVLEPQAIRIATPFGGGVGGTHLELCGALSGGVMVIGALYGRTDASQDDTQAYALAKQYREAFLAEFGYTQCAMLREKVVHAPGGLGSCAVLVERAATILLALLAEIEEAI